jgi:hypothetical protein
VSTATAPAAGAEEWISRADAAELARCSEATIKRLETKHDLETRSGANGQTRLRLADPVDSRHPLLRPGQPDTADEAGDVGVATHHVPVVGVDRCGVDPDEHVVGADLG